MKTIRQLCKRFKKRFPDFDISFDEIESYKGFYRIYITRFYPIELTEYYIFKTCKDFKNWIDNVILD